MTIHEFGKENKETIILIHPSVVKWDYFENVIPLLEKNYHLLVPALPGYDFDNDNDFTSVEQIASGEGIHGDICCIWLFYGRFRCAYGCAGTEG
jgi:hypothetical protein